MPKRKFLSDISTRYRRKLIREESDDLISLVFNKESVANSHLTFNNSASDNDHDEIVRVELNNAGIMQAGINLSLSDETNISESDVSLNNVLSLRAFIREDISNSGK